MPLVDISFCIYVLEFVKVVFVFLAMFGVAFGLFGCKVVAQTRSS